MQTSAAVENASLFEIDQNRRPYQFYLGWYLKGMSIFVVLDGALAKLAVDSRFHRGMFIAAGAASTLVLLAPIAVSFTFERRTSNTLGRLAELTGTDPISTAPFWLVLLSAALLWFALVALWLGLRFKWL
jgi:hypothetical protein